MKLKLNGFSDFGQGKRAKLVPKDERSALLVQGQTYLFNGV